MALRLALWVALITALLLLGRALFQRPSETLALLVGGVGLMLFSSHPIPFAVGFAAFSGLGFAARCQGLRIKMI